MLALLSWLSGETMADAWASTDTLPPDVSELLAMARAKCGSLRWRVTALRPQVGVTDYLTLRSLGQGPTSWPSRWLGSPLSVREGQGPVLGSH